MTDAWGTLTKQKFGLDKGQRYINAGAGNLFDTENNQWVSAPGGGEAAAGLQTVWLQDENGNPVIGQLRKDGSVVRSTMPEGLSPVGPYEGGYEKAKGAAEGKVSGEAAGALPGASQLAQNIDMQIADLKSDPYLDSMLGPVNSRLPNLSAASNRVQAKIDQISGGAFLNARQALKGGGAITDFESQKAEAAYVRMNQAQDRADFVKALDDFNAAVQAGLGKLQAQAGQRRLGNGRQESGGTQRLRYNPATGELE